MNFTGVVVSRYESQRGEAVLYIHHDLCLLVPAAVSPVSEWSLTPLPRGVRNSPPGMFCTVGVETGLKPQTLEEYHSRRLPKRDVSPMLSDCEKMCLWNIQGRDSHQQSIRQPIRALRNDIPTPNSFLEKLGWDALYLVAFNLTPVRIIKTLWACLASA